jgi:hypothetical protein
MNVCALVAVLCSFALTAYMLVFGLTSRLTLLAYPFYVSESDPLRPAISPRPVPVQPHAQPHAQPQLPTGRGSRNLVVMPAFDVTEEYVACSVVSLLRTNFTGRIMLVSNDCSQFQSFLRQQPRIFCAALLDSFPFTDLVNPKQLPPEFRLPFLLREQQQPTESTASQPERLWQSLFRSLWSLHRNGTEPPPPPPPVQSPATARARAVSRVSATSTAATRDATTTAAPGGVKTVMRDNARRPKPPVISKKILFFLAVHFYLLQHGRLHDWVLLSDARDTVFQLSPFTVVEGVSEAHPWARMLLGARGWETNELFMFFLEGGPSPQQTIRIGKEVYNAGWIRQLYGDQVLQQLSDQPVSCSGTLFGSVHGTLRYLSLFVEQVLTLLSRRVDLSLNPLDQGIHNYILHKVIPDRRLQGFSVIYGHTGMVRTAGDRAIGAIDRSRSFVQQDSGLPAPVVHQYTAIPELVDLVERNFCFAPLDPTRISPSDSLQLFLAAFSRRSGRQFCSLPQFSNRAFCLS